MDEIEADGAPVCTEPTRTQKVCGANKRGGGTCMSLPMVGKTRCRIHGGTAKAGFEHGRFKHGLYMKSVPKNLRKQFDELVRDPELLEGRAELAMLNTRLAQLAARIGTNENGPAWRQLAAAMDQFLNANANNDAAGQLAAINTLNGIITGAVNDEVAWKEYTEYAKEVSKIAEREWKRVLKNRQVATVEQVHALFQSLSEAVLLYVTDTKARQQIADHVNRLRVIEPIRVEGVKNE